MQKITAKQKNVLEYIQEYMEQKRENPNPYKLLQYLKARGIGESMKGLMQVIQALEKKELIRRDEKKIYPVKNDSFADLQGFISIPLYGLASCGEALAYADDRVDDYLQLSRRLVGEKAENLFAVKSLGDSMDRDGICDGDYVIFSRCRGGEDIEGKIVVAVINGMATIKRYRRVSQNVIGLFPNSNNANHHPIYLHSSDAIHIAGIFRKVLPVKYVSL